MVLDTPGIVHHKSKNPDYYAILAEGSGGWWQPHAGETYYIFRKDSTFYKIDNWTPADDTNSCATSGKVRLNKNYGWLIFNAGDSVKIRLECQDLNLGKDGKYHGADGLVEDYRYILSIYNSNCNCYAQTLIQ
jgi:hypothetical protein